MDADEIADTPEFREWCSRNPLPFRCDREEALDHQIVRYIKDVYDGAPDSPTRGMGFTLREMEGER